MPIAVSSSAKKRGPNFASRFVQNMRESVSGVIPGMVMLGKAGIGDVGRGIGEVATGGRIDTDFESPELGKAIAKGFWEQSVLPPMFMLDPKEAIRRGSARPFDATLDILGAGFGGAGLAAKGATRAAKAGMIDPTSGPFRALTGLRPVGEANAPLDFLSRISPDASPLDRATAMQGSFDFGGERFKPSMIGGELFARPTARRIVAEGSKDSPDVWASRSRNEFAARMGDIVHKKMMEVNPNAPVVGANSRIYKGLMKSLYSHRSYSFDEFDREWNAKKDEYIKNATREHPDMDKKRLQAAAEIAPTLKFQGYEDADVWLDGKGPYYGRFVPDEDGNLQYEPVEGGVQQRISDLKNELEMYEVQARNLLDKVDIAVYTHGANPVRSIDVDKAFQDMISNDTKDIQRLEMNISRTKKNIESAENELEQFIKTGGKSDWANNFNEIAELRDELNAIMRGEAIVPMFRHLRDMAPMLESRYLTNIQGAWNEHDLSKFKLRDFYANAHREIPRSRIRDEVGPNGEELFHEPGFVPAYRKVKPDPNSRGSVAKPVDLRPVVMPEMRLATDPEDLIYSGNQRLDMDIFRDKFKDESNTFANNMWREDLAKMFQNVSGAELKPMLISGRVALPDKLTGALTVSDTPMVAVDKSGGLASEAARTSAAVDEIMYELIRSGNTSEAEKLAHLRNSLDNGGVGSKALMRAIAKKKPGRLYPESRAEAIDDAGEFLLMPRHTYEAFVADVGRSKNFLMKALEAPTEVWKNLVLHARPKWIVNNSVGSLMLLMLGEGAPSAARHLVKNSKLRDRLGESMFGSSWRDVGSGGERHKFDVPQPDGTTASKELTIGEYIQEVLPELTYSHGSSWMYRSEFLKGSSNSFKQRYSRLMDSIADFNARVADDPARIAKASAIFERRVDDMKAYLDELGAEEIPSDPELMQALMSDPAIRREIVDEVLGDLIDFQDMTPFERDYVRAFVPFWSWIKGSSKVAGRSLSEHPTRLASYNYLSGEANRELEERYGSLPSFLLGSVPVPEFLQNESGTRVVGTSGMMPLSTGADVLSQGASMIPFVGSSQPLFGPESPISMLGPIPKSGIEALTGRDVFFGTPLPRGQSVGTSFLKKVLSTPQSNMYLKNFEGFPPERRIAGPGGTTVRNPWFDIAGYMGAPTPMDLRLGPARARAREEEAELLGPKL